VKRNWKRIVLIVAVVLLVAIQLAPVDRSNPPVEADLEAPPAVTAVLRQACYDCHSNETQWPWYSYVAPVSWLVAHDIEEARGEFSFSHWGRLGERERAELRAEIWEKVEEGEMPLPIYRLMHSEARLSQDQLDTVREWAMD
jgi:hypothetical protein